MLRHYRHVGYPVNGVTRSSVRGYGAALQLDIASIHGYVERHTLFDAQKQLIRRQFFE